MPSKKTRQTWRADGTQPARPHPPSEDEAVHTGRRHPHAQREQEARPMQTRRSGHPPPHDRPSASASKSHLNRSRSHPRIPIDVWMAKTPRPATNFAHTHAIDPLPAERQAAALSPCPRTRQAGNDDERPTLQDPCPHMPDQRRRVRPLRRGHPPPRLGLLLDDMVGSGWTPGGGVGAAPAGRFGAGVAAGAGFVTIGSLTPRPGREPQGRKGA